MKISDYDEVRSLWKNAKGIRLTKADSRASLAKYLLRNKGLCFVALSNTGKIIGAVIAGHDSRRAYLSHLAVDEKYRRNGIGSALANKCLKKIKSLGIEKCTLFVFKNNSKAKKFWESEGWITRTDLTMMQKITNG